MEQILPREALMKAEEKNLGKRRVSPAMVLENKQLDLKCLLLFQGPRSQVCYY
jgi:hypothetical protein